MSIVVCFQKKSNLIPLYHAIALLGPLLTWFRKSLLIGSLVRQQQTMTPFLHTRLIVSPPKSLLELMQLL